MKDTTLEAGHQASLKSVFICGCGHSGTTLVANILAGHPQVYAPLVETGIFLHDPDVARGRFMALRQEAVSANAAILVEKTPRHIHHLGLIREIVGDPKFIIPVRDGRDAAASMARRYGRLRRGTNRWIEETSIALSERERDDVFCYRHEDLVERPAEIVASICSFVGIAFHESLLQFHQTKRLWFSQTEIRRGSGVKGPEHDALRNWQINQPIFDSRGRWKSEWSADDMREIVEGRGKALMLAFGYLKEA